MNIQEFRAENPAYDDLDDNVLAEKLHAKSYSDIPFEEFKGKFIGQTAQVKQNVEPPIDSQPITQPVAQPQARPSMAEMFDKYAAAEYSPAQQQAFEELARRHFSFKEFVEPMATMATGALAEPVAGIAGIAQSLNPWAEEGAGAKAVEGTREALTYQPRTEGGQQTLSEVGEVAAPAGETLEAIETGLGDVTFDITGSPALAATAASLPTALFELAGLASLKSLRPGTVLKNASGEATSVLKKHLHKEGIDYEKLDQPTKDSIPEVLEPSALPGAKPVKEEAKRVLAQHLESGSSDGSLATKQLDEYGNVVDFAPGKEAIKQGFRPGFIQAVKVSSPETKSMMKKMLSRMRQIQGNERLALDVRPTGIVGESVMKRVNHIRDRVNTESKNLASIVKENLPGKKVNTDGIFDTVDDILKDLDIDLDDAGNPTFKGSMIELNTPAQKAIKDTMSLLGGQEIDAVRAHKLKRQFDDLIDYKKKSAEGLSEEGRRAMKKVRGALNDAVRDIDINYAEANDVIHKGLDGLEDINDAVGKKYNLLDPKADEIIGQEMRKLMSNYGKRHELGSAIETMDEIAKEFGGVFDDDIKSLSMFANALDDRFGAVAKTSLQGTMEQAGSKVARDAIVSPKMAALDVVTKGAGKGLDKLRGINDFNAFESLDALLKEVNQ